MSEALIYREPISAEIARLEAGAILDAAAKLSAPLLHPDAAGLVSSNDAQNAVALLDDIAARVDRNARPCSQCSKVQLGLFYR